MSMIKTEMDGINSAIQSVSENSKGLVNAFLMIASAISTKKPDHPTSQTKHGPTKSSSELALDQCAEMFLGVVSDNSYVNFIAVLESNTKAQTFLVICRNSNEHVVLKWLEKQVKDLHQHDTL